MRILPFVFMLFCFSSSALAGVFCFPGYKYSDNYSFEFTCKADLYFDLLSGKTYETSCTKGLIYYYYCKKN